MKYAIALAAILAATPAMAQYPQSPQIERLQFEQYLGQLQAAQTRADVDDLRQEQITRDNQRQFDSPPPRW